MQATQETLRISCYSDASLRSADLGVDQFLQAEQVRRPPCRRANPSVSRNPGRTRARSLRAPAPHSCLSGPMAGAQTHHQEEGKPRDSKPSPLPFQLMLAMPPSAPESRRPAAPRQGHTQYVFPMGNQETAQLFLQISPPCHISYNCNFTNFLTPGERFLLESFILS